MLGGLFFFSSSNSAEQNAYEGFVSAAYSLNQKRLSGAIQEYSLDEILQEVTRRSNPNIPVSPIEAIHPETGKSIMRKVSSRKKGMPWLDVVGRAVSAQSASRLKGSQLDGAAKAVQVFNLNEFVNKGVLLVIDYSPMDEQSYALILSYFLRVCHRYRQDRKEVGIVQLVDEAHRVFDNESRHSASLAACHARRAFR